MDLNLRGRMRWQKKREAICFNVTYLRHTSRRNNLLPRKFLPPQLAGP